MILQSLPSRALVCAMLTLVLEGTRMLGLDVHVDGALVLLHEGTMRALKLAGLGANVFESHWGTYQSRRAKIQFFWSRFGDNSGIRFFGAVSATTLVSDFLASDYLDV